MLRKFILAALLLTSASSATADWVPVVTGLRSAPAVRLLSSGKHLLLLQAKKLSVIDPDGSDLRTAYTLRSQSDALVDLAIADGNWFLASRQRIWVSEDEGFSWRTLIELTPKEKNEWLALLPHEGTLIAASRHGLKAIAMGTQTSLPFGPRGTIDEAVQEGGVLLWESKNRTSLYRNRSSVPLSLRGRPTALLPQALETLVATDSALFTCNAKGSCEANQGPPGAQSLARQNGYWAATTDGIWRTHDLQQAWEPESDGLGGARGGRLHSAFGRLWLLADEGLFVWKDEAIESAELAGLLVPDASAPPPIPPPIAPTGPSIGAVREMVYRTLDFPPDDSWRERVRWKAAAPTLAFNVRRRTDDRSTIRRMSNISISTTANRFIIAPEGAWVSDLNSDGVDYSLSLNWRLDDLIFHREELAVSDQYEQLFRRREIILLDVTRIYFDRLRAIARHSAQLPENESIELKFRIAQLTAELDFYTGGRFSKALEEESAQPQRQTGVP